MVLCDTYMKIVHIKHFTHSLILPFWRLYRRELKNILVVFQGIGSNNLPQVALSSSCPLIRLSKKGHLQCLVSVNWQFFTHSITNTKIYLTTHYKAPTKIQCMRVTLEQYKEGCHFLQKWGRFVELLLLFYLTTNVSIRSNMLQILKLITF